MKIGFSPNSKALIALCSCAFLLPSNGFAWQADNRLNVSALPSGDAFEVVGRPGSAGADYWCAAGDYALQILGAPASARLYLVRARGAPVNSTRKSAVHFSLTPVGTEPQRNPPFLSMKSVGDNLSVSFARNYCLDSKNLEF